MSGDEHNELQHQLSEVLAWIRRREGRDDRVSDELFDLVHRIEHRAAIAVLRHDYDAPLVTDVDVFAVRRGASLVGANRSGAIS